MYTYLLHQKLLKICYFGKRKHFIILADNGCNAILQLKASKLVIYFMSFTIMYMIDLNVLNLMVCSILHINCNYIITFIG